MSQVPATTPFDAIRPQEISLTSTLLKNALPDTKLLFTAIDRQEPPKDKALQWIQADRHGGSYPNLPRITFSYFVKAGSPTLYKALVNVSQRHVITIQPQPEGVVGPMQGEDYMELEKVCMDHPAVKAEIEKLKLPKGVTPCTDPWIYGTDTLNEKRTLIQFYMYLKANDHPETNHYSLPLKFSPVFDGTTREFVRIDYLPGGADEKTIPTQPWKPVECVEYHADFCDEPPRQVKPYVVQQAEGPSFNTSGNTLEWLGWKMRIVTNYREGVALYDVSFKNRDVFYRISLSEMTVPYGDPRAPFHRKQAFDLGDCGFGHNANQLKLGCDCLGFIKYYDFYRTDRKGNPILMTNTVCVHEQDYGLLMKHVNYRNEKAFVTRNRELVIQTIATVANYEYIIEYIFDQAGGIDIQVRATGILSTMPIDEDVVVPWGTNVGPGVMAAYHQHLLSFRLDPAIDGHQNTFCYDDSVPLPYHPIKNPYKVGFVTERSIVDKAGGVDQSPFTNREYKIINENKINRITKKPVGYKISLPAAQMIIMDKDSMNTKRAHFATKQLWVTKYSDDALYAAGEFTNQSKKDTGLEEWANGIDNVRNEDIVLWATVGFTHIPRPEDFPVMPVEIHTVHIRPNGFFERNPALDVPQSNQNFNKSILVNESVGDVSNCCSKQNL